MKKMILGLLICACLAFNAGASPALQEQRDYCVMVANNVVAGQDAKKLNMPESELEARLMEYILKLAAAGAPEQDIKELVEAVVIGYFGHSTPEKVFEACMNRKTV